MLVVEQCICAYMCGRRAMYVHRGKGRAMYVCGGAVYEGVC